jgi:hypothetical protein
MPVGLPIYGAAMPNPKDLEANYEYFIQKANF